MAAIEDKDKDLILHTIKVHVRENHLEGVDGDYMLRVSNERTLYPEDIVQAMRTRGQYAGDSEAAVALIKAYDLERMYQVLDGFRVADLLTIVHARVTGMLKTPYEEIDKDKHHVDFSSHVRRTLRKYIKNVKLEKEDFVAPPKVHVTYLYDFKMHKDDHNIYEPGRVIAIYGKQIKVEGDPAKVGVFFVPVDAPDQRVQMDIAENKPSRITGIAPNTNYVHNRIEIVTQYNGGKEIRDEPRTITSIFVVDAL